MGALKHLGFEHLQQIAQLPSNALTKHQNFPLQNVGCSRGFRVQEEEAEMEGEGFTFARRITEMYIFLAGRWAYI